MMSAATARGDHSWHPWGPAPAAQRGQQASEGLSTRCTATPIGSGPGLQVGLAA